jgi:hypothetical protein
MNMASPVPGLGAAGPIVLRALQRVHSIRSDLLWRWQLADRDEDRRLPQRRTIAGLTSALTPCWREDHLDAAGWQRGALQFEVHLGDGDEYARPSASAMLLAPVTGSAAQTCQRHIQGRAINAQLRVLAVSRYCPRAGPPRLAESKSPVPSCAPPPGCV